MCKYMLGRINEQLLDVIGVDFAWMGITSQVERCRRYDEPCQYLGHGLPAQDTESHESRMFTTPAHPEKQTDRRRYEIALVPEFSRFDARTMPEFFQLGRDVFHDGTNDVLAYAQKCVVEGLDVGNVHFGTAEASVNQRQSVTVLLFHDAQGDKTST